MTSLVIAEHDNASIKGATLNTVTAAIACGGDVHVLVAGANAAEAAKAAAQIAGVAKVIHAEGAHFEHGLAENVAAQVLESMAGVAPRFPQAFGELLGVLDRLGADPVNMPMGEVYSAMAKGVIDGVVAPPDTFVSLHFGEIAGYYSSLAVPRGAYPARAMNLEKWETLTDGQKAVLERGVEVWEAALADENRAAGERGMAEARKRNVQFASVSAAEQDRFDRLYLEDARLNARALERFGIDGLETFRIARNSVAARDQIVCGDRV